MTCCLARGPGKRYKGAMTLLGSLLALLLASSLLTVAATCLMNAVFRGEPVRLSGAGLAFVLFEWLSTVRAYALQLLFVGRPSVRRHAGSAPSQPRHPVLLVPGYSLNRSSLHALARYLHKCGWDWVHVVNNAPFDAPIDTYAENLAREVQVLRAASGAAKVDIVGHSMGGIVAATYIQSHGGAGVVRRLVTLGTPWAGSRLWVITQRTHGEELAPDHPTVQAAQAPPCAVTSVWSPHDNIVLPATSSDIDFGENVVLPGLGHCSLLYAHPAHAAVGEALATPVAEKDPQ